MTRIKSPKHPEDIRRLLDESLPFLFDAGAVGAKAPDTKRLIKGLFELYTRAGSHMETASPESFAKVWLLRGIVHELLQYSIEDDYIDLSKDRLDILEAFRALAREDHWFDHRLESALSTCRDVATKNPITNIRVQMTLHDDLHVIGRLAPHGKPPIRVSTKAYPLVPILEDSITHPDYVRAVIAGYARNIEEMKRELGVNALCFVEKDVGPVGALSMLSMLVHEVNIPATIYRTNHWSARAKVAARTPVAEDRFVIVYDLLVTGDGIQQVAADLQTRFGANVLGAVVLFGYEEKRQLLPMAGGKSLAVRTLGWYNDLADEVEKVREHGEQTKHLRVLVGDHIVSSNLRYRSEGIDSTKEEPMPSQSSSEETLGVVIAALEDFDREELLAIAEFLYPNAEPRSKPLSLRQIRRVLVEQAKTLYHNQPQALQAVRRRVREVALRTLAKVD